MENLNTNEIVWTGFFGQKIVMDFEQMTLIVIKQGRVSRSYDGEQAKSLIEKCLDYHTRQAQIEKSKGYKNNAEAWTVNALIHNRLDEIIE